MKKSPSAKSGVEKTRTQILSKELASLCKLLDEQGLEFLKHQAEILLHNARIEAVRKKASEAAAPAPERPGKKDAKPAAEKSEIAYVKKVWIEKTDHNFFNIHVGRNRIFFNRDEMRSLTKICHASGSVSEGTTRLYRWFERERKDFLNDSGIEMAGHPSLAELYEIILHTYKVKD